MIVNTDNMISVTKLQRELMKKLKEVSETKEPLYVLRNNEVAVVMLSPEEYNLLQEAEELLEHLGVADAVEKRLAGHDPSKNIPWQKIRETHAL
jgi:PHD/YefM family antitoxin component YafN of YafNO toxin-antitoxin module